jgi:hypothetical protein
VGQISPGMLARVLIVSSTRMGLITLFFFDFERHVNFVIVSQVVVTQAATLYIFSSEWMLNSEKSVQTRPHPADVTGLSIRYWAVQRF